MRGRARGRGGAGSARYFPAVPSGPGEWRSVTTAECHSVQKVDSEHPKAPCSRDHRVRPRPEAGEGPCCTWGEGVST